jgi:putative membrane-bound dehydrogenase-like protein
MTNYKQCSTAPSTVRQWLSIALISALPLSYTAFAADPAPATKAATKPATKPTADAKKPEDKNAWKIAENWKLDIVLEKPAIHHPSVLFPAPDGRIFLAEDPMDMKGSSKEPTDRILVIHPDGKVTVFAEGLYAVFGLQYIDGKLYVHHTPKLSVFKDVDSVGKDRVDLIDSDNPSPNVDGHGFNDHIPSNLRLAMDGYLYITTGDKGIYNAQSNVDHSKATIHGGGIMRMRPDGTDIEVYSTGTRNHLDVAVNSEDEMFTYDNTDDGLGWWARFTHMVDGGSYGYPYDYRPPENDKEVMPEWNAQRQAYDKAKQEWDKANKDKPEAQQSPKPQEPYASPFKPWTLWRMEEYGGGSPTGSVAYNEEALPPEYHGNIFASEWGKGEVERIAVERNGGTYKVTKREVILKGGPGALRPVGIQVLPDGSGIIVADWNFAGWRNAQADAGRLLKLTYTGKLTPTPRPQWYVPAATGKEFNATTAELIAGLSHPAECVRLVAQRRLVDRGNEAVAPLIAVLKDASAPAHARWHAVWALDRMNDKVDLGRALPPVGLEAMLAVLKDVKGDKSVRMQIARELGTRRVKSAVPALVEMLNEEDEALRFRAATALGRIGDTAAVNALIDKLGDHDLFTHYAIFTAINRIAKANPTAWPTIVEALSSDRTEQRDGAALAMHETYDETLVKTLGGLIADKSKPADARAAAVAAIAPLQRQRQPWTPIATDLKWWGTMPARNPAPPKDLDWAGTKAVMEAVRAALNDANDVVRHAAVQGLKFAPDPSATDTLVKLFNSDKDVPTRKAILAALAAAKSPAISTFVDQILSEAKQNDALFTQALEAAELTGGPENTAVVLKFVAADNKPEQLVTALETLAKLPDVKSLPVLVKRLVDPNGNVINAAANAIGAINDDKAVAAVAPLLKDSRVEVKRGAVNAMAGIKRASCLEPLLAVWQEKDIQKEAILALAARADVKALDAYIEGLSMADGNVRGKSRKAIEATHEKALPLIEARLDSNPPSARAVAELQQIYEKFIPAGQRTGKLYKFDTKALAPEAFWAFAKNHTGDVGHGKKIFNDANGVGCVKCHKVANQGGDIGPALDGVGGKYPRDFLIESILYPSKQILDGYQQTMIKRKSNGNLEAGIVRAETDDSVTLVDSAGQKIVIKKDDIASRKISNISLMPEGLQTALKPEEFVDVIAYLESLKESPKK